LVSLFDNYGVKRKINVEPFDDRGAIGFGSKVEISFFFQPIEKRMKGDLECSFSE
jgi:hypothetical protein